MSSRVDREGAVSLAVVLGIAALAVLVPLTALSGITATEKSDGEPKVLERQDQRPATGSSGTYILRCWQYGRLVFEETGVRVDFEGDANQSKMRGTDRQGLPLVVADTRNATCLIRSERTDGSKGR